jgi:hypothetical protein
LAGEQTPGSKNWTFFTSGYFPVYVTPSLVHVSGDTDFVVIPGCGLTQVDVPKIE